MKQTLSFLLILLLFTSSFAISQTKTRDDIDAKYKWNLEDLYSSVDEWNADLKAIEKRIPEITEFQGKLAESSKNLLTTLDNMFSIYKNYSKLSSYSARLKDQDLGNSGNSSLAQQASSLGTKLSEAASFFDPEVLAINKATMDKFYKEESKLLDYKIILEDVQRLREHTLTEAQEKIMASFGLIGANQYDVYGIFTNAEMPREEITLANGEKVKLTSSAFAKYRTSENRKDRAMVFDKFFNNYGQFEKTIGANLTGHVKGDYVRAKNKNYDTALEAALNRNNIPTSVYKNLIEQINNSLPTLHRFLTLKKEMLGFDTLYYYDLYTSMVEKADMNFSVEEGQKIILKSLKPLGSEYTAVLQKAFDERWVDYYPTDGKRSGAYSTGGEYDQHPYILMNWTDDYNSVSTFAHELGHTMHSYLSNQNQPYQNSQYPIFVAEIASTLNENLMNDYMVENAKTDKEKLFILGSYLEMLRGTLFRQVSFAEFEWEIHKKIEAGDPLNGEIMSNIYYDIVKRYYGHDQGVTIVPEYIKYEWAYIPHFYYNYYVYQYATSIIYATAFYEKIKEDGDDAVKDYFQILKGGGSDYPISLVKKAGVDPMSAEPFELAMKRMNDVMDKIEEIFRK
ncbi:MAG: oligoendopeptidase F [Melioribacteraceae bacterium]|jgi:oligoendopeptidase F|nr:oligoendopeptidase F [Melioribacteraceae bacterium]